MIRPAEPATILTPDPAAPGLWTGTFPSGLRLVVREDHRLPVAVANVWVRSGSNREPEDLRGWSHGIEHMLFKGTARRGEADFAREVANGGGSTNAGTGYETTNYHITVPVGNLGTAIDLLGDALFHAVFDPAALDAEREVLVHENHMYDDQPFGFGLTWRLGLERALDTSPYRHPIGGRDENLRERSREDILTFWRSAYRADNMTMVVVGDVDPAQVEAQVAAAFPVASDAVRPAGGDPRIVIVTSPPVEPPHLAARLRVETGEIRKAYAKLIFPAPGEHDPRQNVLPVLRRTLGDGRSCRLHRQLLEEAKLVDDFMVATETGPREGLVIIDLETDVVRLADALGAVGGILGDLGRDGCTDQERERAVTRVRRSHVFNLESVQGQAASLGYHDAIDDLPGAFEMPARVAAVTNDQVAALARDLFRPETATVMLYLPRETAAGTAGLPTDDDTLQELLAGAFGRETTVVVADNDPLPPAGNPNRPGEASAGEDFRQDRLDCGTMVHWRHDPSVPVVAISFIVPGGAADETAATSGVAALTRAVQLKGAGGRTAAAFHARLEDLGISMHPHAGRDHDGFMVTTLAERLDTALDLAADVLLRPTFADSEVAQERSLALAHLQSLQDEPFQAAALAVRALLYGDHPYGRPQVGTTESLPGLEGAMLRAHHARSWTSSHLQVVVSGDVDPDLVLPGLDRMLEDMPRGDGTPPPVPGPQRPLAEVESLRLARDQNQSVVLLAWPGPPDADQHRVPLMLLRQVLNGQSGRLFEALRNRRSLCYNTGMVGTSGRGPGMLLGYVLTAPTTAEAARDALLVELAGITADIVPATEFVRAQTELLGNLLISDQTNAARVSRRAGDLLHGRSRPGLGALLEDVAACTPDQVREAAAAYLHADRFCEVILGPAAG